jgi:dTMP kinase
MFVVFEGIDGSGKTTISNRAALALRESGLTVTHVREGGTLASPVAESIRDFGRDERHLALEPGAELLIYLAREAQLFDEVTRPALAAVDVVIADRFFYSAEVLACAGRGLAPELVRPVVESASRQIAPDLVILVDVDPHIARARRRVAKVLKDGGDASPSRKGLAGASLFHRMRDGYLALAARDPERWLVLDNSDCELSTIVARIVRAVREARKPGGAARRPAAGSLADAGRQARLPTPFAGKVSHEGALPAFLAWVDRRSTNEPGLAAYMLSGLSGPMIDERRAVLAEHAPELTAFSLQGVNDESSWRLRWQLLDRAPRQVARSLSAPTPDCDQRDRLRRALKFVAPADLAASMSGDASAAAFGLRDALFAQVPAAVIGSLATLGGLPAWALRERWLAEVGGVAALDAGAKARVICRSLTGLEDERAWELRTLARGAAPIGALASLAGVSSPLAWRWRDETRLTAPKTVLATLRGMDDPRAWDLREALAPRCKEALDSMLGLNHPRAWRLRTAYADAWPGGVVQSLGDLAESSRGSQLIADLLSRHPADLSLLKHAAAAESAAFAYREPKAACREPKAA